MMRRVENTDIRSIVEGSEVTRQWRSPKPVVGRRLSVVSKSRFLGSDARCPARSRLGSRRQEKADPSGLKPLVMTKREGSQRGAEAPLYQGAQTGEARQARAVSGAAGNV